ncbi:MAG: sugar phosphate isomerase/epimerase family protein [bacterium]
MSKRYDVELYCGRCRRTTAHLVTTGTGGLSRVLCIVCGRAVAVDTLRFMEQYVDGVVRRLLAKPFEITTEFRRSPRDFISSLPGRAFTKPFRVAAELRATMDIFRPRRRRIRPPAPTLPSAPGELPAADRHCQVLLSAPLLWAHDPAEIVDVAHDLGYDGVEFWAYQLRRERTDPVALGAQARKQGLALTLHALSWDLNPASRIDSIRTASLEALHESVELASRLGARMVIVHPGHTTDPHDDAEIYWPGQVAAIREVADHAAEHGQQVAVEHMEPRQGEYVITPEDVNRLMREADRPNVGTVLDVAHIPWGEDEPAFLSRLERLTHVHFSDADETRLHLPLGQGGRDLARVLAGLHGFRGAIALEGFSAAAGTDLARWNKAQFEELWRESSVEKRAGLTAIESPR